MRESARVPCHGRPVQGAGARAASSEPPPPGLAHSVMGGRPCARGCRSSWPSGPPQSCCRCRQARRPTRRTTSPAVPRLTRDSLAVLDCVGERADPGGARAREPARSRALRRGMSRPGTAEDGWRQRAPPLDLHPTLPIRAVDRHAASDRSLPPRLQGDHLRRPPLQPALALPLPGPDHPRGRLVLLSGRVVGLDKINHFIREGLAHWRAVHERREDIASVLGRELDPARARLALDGVWPQGDVADRRGRLRRRRRRLLGVHVLERPAVDWTGAVIRRARCNGRTLRAGASFTFADYVTDAWDEAINVSDFHPTLGREVEAALRLAAWRFPSGTAGRWRAAVHPT